MSCHLHLAQLPSLSGFKGPEGMTRLAVQLRVGRVQSVLLSGAEISSVHGVHFVSWHDIRPSFLRS